MSKNHDQSYDAAWGHQLEEDEDKDNVYISVYADIGDGRDVDDMRALVGDDSVVIEDESTSERWEYEIDDLELGDPKEKVDYKNGILTFEIELDESEDSEWSSVEEF